MMISYGLSPCGKDKPCHWVSAGGLLPFLAQADGEQWMVNAQLLSVIKNQLAGIPVTSLLAVCILPWQTWGSITLICGIDIKFSECHSK